MDNELLTLINKFVENQPKPVNPHEVVHLSLSLSATEAKEVTALLEKLRNDH